MGRINVTSSIFAGALAPNNPHAPQVAMSCGHVMSLACIKYHFSVTYRSKHSKHKCFSNLCSSLLQVGVQHQREEACH